MRPGRDKVSNGCFLGARAATDWQKIYRSLSQARRAERARLQAGCRISGMTMYRKIRFLLPGQGLIFYCLCVLATAQAPLKKPESPISSIGCFINVKSDGEHAFGYSVRLWLQGDRLFGLVDYHRGPVGDPPLGILTDVRYDAPSGKLSFKAKLTSGLHSCRIHKNVPAHDLLSFDGFLKPDGLVGNIRIEDQLDSPPVVTDSRDSFVMLRDRSCLTQKYGSYEEWWRYWEPIYKVRGAKW